jgi:ketosteroid isomerase-like protein
MSDPADDRSAIVERLHTYGWALDDQDWAALASCFTEDAEVDYGAAIGVYRGGAAVAALCQRVLVPLDSSQHVITNHQVTVTGDAAEARCHVVAQHTRAAAGGGANYTIGGTYRVVLVRANGGWRIRRFALEMRWHDGNPAVLEGA